MYDLAASLGYDWINLSHHGWYLADGNVNLPQVGWLLDPNNSPVRINYPAGTGPLIDVAVPSASGLPDYTTAPPFAPLWSVGQPPELKYNESLSLSTAADARTVDGSFLALSGREWGKSPFLPTGVEPLQGGHKIAVLASSTSKICATTSVDPAHICADESELFSFVAAHDGATIQAHPGPTVSDHGEVKERDHLAGG